MDTHSLPLVTSTVRTIEAAKVAASPSTVASEMERKTIVSNIYITQHSLLCLPVSHHQVIFILNYLLLFFSSHFHYIIYFPGSWSSILITSHRRSRFRYFGSGANSSFLLRHLLLMPLLLLFVVLVSSHSRLRWCCCWWWRWTIMVCVSAKWITMRIFKITMWNRNVP